MAHGGAAASPEGSVKRGPARLTLRARVFLLVALVNFLIFGAGLLFLSQTLAEERERAAREQTELLVYTLQRTVTSSGDIHVARILAWPYWRSFEDAVILGLRADEVREDGNFEPAGVSLNPVGCAARPADFSRRTVLRDIARAVSTGRRVTGLSGTAVPIFGPDGEVWGGCWFALREEALAVELLVQLLPWFFFSTLLLTLGTFFVLRKFVLDPVRLLSRGANRLASGERDVHLEDPGRQDELAELIRGFNHMAEMVQGFNERLAHEVEVATAKARSAEQAAVTQRRLAATGELAAGIAHEINNPLGGLINAVDVLAAGKQTPEKRSQYHELLRTGLKRIQTTVGQLLRFTPRQADSGPASLAGAVLGAVALVEHRARKQGVDILFGGAPGTDVADPEAVSAAWTSLPRLHGDEGELGQSVLNLIVNALDALEDAAPGEGHILLRLWREEDELVLVVRDNGPGVSADELDRVADIFYTTKEVGKGSGLGLAMVHNVVAAHGGRVHLASAPGEGFEVRLRFPVVESGA